MQQTLPILSFLVASIPTFIMIATYILTNRTQGKFHTLLHTVHVQSPGENVLYYFYLPGQNDEAQCLH